MGSCLCKQRNEPQYNLNCEGSTHKTSQQTITLSSLQTAIDGVEAAKESLENEIEKCEQELNETR
jgi:hypothetical protein